MNFSEALDLLKQGKKVRRSCWDSAEKLYLENNKFCLAAYGIVGTIGVHYDDMLAEDWEEYKEQLLTKKEKEYLKATISLYSGKIVRLKKHLHNSVFNNENNYVIISFYSKNGYVGETLRFDIHEHFKGLEAGEEYTLEELGLEEENENE